MQSCHRFLLGSAGDGLMLGTRLPGASGSGTAFATIPPDALWLFNPRGER